MTPEDFNSALLDPIYDALGVSARLICSDAAVDVTVMDKTEGVTILTGGQFKTEEILPVAAVRLSELTDNGLKYSDISDGQLLMGVDTENAQTWRITSTRHERGEAWLILQEQARNE